jgi:magnesium-transporting ATPase (P-type)
MDRPPRSRTEHLITWSLLIRAYLWLGPLQSLATIVAFYVLYWTYGDYHGQWLDLPAYGPLYQGASAMALATVVTTQIGNLFAHRTERVSVLRIGWFTNPLAWVGIATELGLLALIIYVPILQGIFHTAVFPPVYWLFLLAWTPALLVMDEVRKALARQWEHGRRRAQQPGSR